MDQPQGCTLGLVTGTPAEPVHSSPSGASSAGASSTHTNSCAGGSPASCLGRQGPGAE